MKIPSFRASPPAKADLKNTKPSGSARSKQGKPIPPKTALASHAGDDGAPTSEKVAEPTGSKEVVLALEKGKGKDKKMVGDTTIRKRSSKDRKSPDVQALNKAKRLKAARTGPETPIPKHAFGPADDVADAAMMLSKVTRLDRPLPPPDTLIRSGEYTQMALQNSIFLTSLNEVVSGYESDAKKDRRRVEDAREIASDLQVRLDRREKGLKAEKEVAAERLKDLVAEKKKRAEAETRTLLSESAKAKCEARNAELSRRLEEEIDLRNVMVKRAIAEAQKNFKDKMSRSAAHAAELSGSLRVSVHHLAQMEANIELIKLHKEGKIPCLDAELSNLNERVLSLAGADDKFDGILSDLQTLLVVSPIPEEPLADRHLGHSIETIAAQVGVDDPSGSMRRTPGVVELARDGSFLENLTGTEDEPRTSTATITGKVVDDEPIEPADKVTDEEENAKLS